MEPQPKAAEKFKEGETVGAWLPADLRTVFRAHVGNAQGASSKYAANAIREQLKRDGAFDKFAGNARTTDALKDLQPDELAVVVEFAELVKVEGPLNAKARIEATAVATSTAAGGR